MINNISNILNTKLRFTGMASGLDTDAIVEQMMRVEQLKVDKAMQDKQILEWKRDDYRSITNLLRGFKDEFYDILKPASNMTSANTYYKYKASSSDDSVVTATSNAKVFSLDHIVTVHHLAEAARLEGGEVQLSDGSEALKLNDSLEKVMEKLGLDVEDTLKLTINDKEIELSKEKSLNDLITAVNNSGAGVSIAYSTFLEKFSVTTKSMGEDAKIDLTQSSEFFTKLGFTDLEKSGKNASFEIDSKLVTNHKSNIFTADGVVYTFKGQGTADVSLKQDVDAVYDKIKGFIDKYNEIVESLSGKIDEDRPKTGGKATSYYLPLTQEQRMAMSEKDIENWDEKAKQGLLKNDNMLNDLLFRLRRVMGDTTEAGGLFSIGISTGDWREGAKLFIDEAKLKKAISDNPDQVMNIFAKESSQRYDPDATGAERSKRYEESGIVNRLFDVLQDNIRTTRNINGKKGMLLEKAGIIGDVTEFQSSLVKEINKKDQLIESLMEKLYIKQETLYAKFAALETSLSRMNSQSSWLQQQLGGGQW